MPESAAELELGLEGTNVEPTEGEVRYKVALRFTDPSSSLSPRLKSGECRINFEELLESQADAQAYGEKLWARVFKDERIEQEYREARAVVENSGRKLRLRLLIDDGNPSGLHGLRWELLRDPKTHTTLATSERVLFSRLMESPDWREVKLRPKAALKALIAVAAPSNLEEYGLEAVDRAGELDGVRGALVGIEPLVLERPVTLNRLIERLRAGVDIVYLVCHGVLTAKLEPYLFLEKDDGKTARVEGAKLAERIGELAEPPRLMVLASCESAGKEDSPMGGRKEFEGVKTAAAQVALAPRLAGAGVAAIVAMQGKISKKTVKQAMPVFFRELLKDGQIDRAMAVARGTVQERPDNWMPALFLRLREGRIWSPKGHYSGTTKLAFCDRLGDDWKRLADFLQIRRADQDRFDRGNEARGIWHWLENRDRLAELSKACIDIDRPDVAELLKAGQ